MPFKHKKKRKYISNLNEHDDRNRRRRDRSPSSRSSSLTDSDESDYGDDLRSIGSYIKNRPEMVRQMFHAVPARHLNAILPDVLKDVSIKELQKLCVEQVEVMSKKRIRYTLAGKEMTSSSGTEDSTSSEDDANKNAPMQAKLTKVPSIHSETSDVQQPDSTSADQIISDLLSDNIKSAVDIAGGERVQISTECELEALATNYELDFGLEVDHESVTEDCGSPVSSTTQLIVRIDDGFPTDKNETVSSDAKDLPQEIMDVNADCSSSIVAESPPADLSESLSKETKSSTVRSSVEQIVGIAVQSVDQVGKNIVDSDVNDAFLSNKEDNNNDETESPLDYSEDESEAEEVASIVQDTVANYDGENVKLADHNIQRLANTGNDLEEGEIEERVTPIVEQNNSGQKSFGNEVVIEQVKPGQHVTDVEVSRIGSNDAEPSASEKRSFPNSSDDESANNNIDKKTIFSSHASGGAKFEPLIVKEREEMECYDSDIDYAGECADEGIYPPGMEPAKAPTEKCTKENQESINDESLSVVKKCSLVPIRILYKQLKEEKERKKKVPKPKIYGAKEPIWTKMDEEEKKKLKISSKESTGPNAPKKSDLMLPDVLANDESNRRLYNELIESDDNKIKKPKKKSNILLTDTFLADLDRQKIEHDIEMNRKAKLLKELKNQRQKIIEKEKKVEKDIKKQLDLGIIIDDNSLHVASRKKAINESNRLSLVDEKSRVEGDPDIKNLGSPGISGCSSANRSFNATDLDSVSICLGEKGREVIVNEKADCMRRAFTIGATSSEEDGEIDHSNSMRVCHQRDVSERGSSCYSQRHGHRSRYHGDPDRQHLTEKVSHSHSRSPKSLNIRRSADDCNNNSKCLSQCRSRNEEDSSLTRKKTRSKLKTDYLENVTSSNEEDLDLDSKTQVRRRLKKQPVHIEEVGNLIRSSKSSSLSGKSTTEIEVSQKLELYELEMRARAIKALMKSKNI
uniref:Uncharacterized protein n=1 Tax=Romanomermis culicivorax TaxID=13658 RepID=A0A915KA73_ROMCU